MSGSSTAVPGETVNLGELLVRKGLVQPSAIDEALRVQQELKDAGQHPVPRLGEVLVDRGHVTAEHVIEALGDQDKQILRCPRCGVRVNVRTRQSISSYKCARCEETLVPPVEAGLRVEESAVIHSTRDPLPEEVENAAKDAGRKFGKYLLLTEIGRGAVGVVYRAWDTFLNQYVALKLIKPPSDPADEGGLWRETRVSSLLKEARNAVRLRHPNIVTVYDVGRIHREYYIAMEHLRGTTLAERIRRSRDTGELTPFHDQPRKWIHVMRDLARAVHYAHTRPNPIVHCDLKPSNIFIDEAGRAHILDFGLARELNSLSRDASGTVRGTPCYMSPEQAGGRNDQIDSRTDVYGLGAILYELLTGRPPFDGDLVEVLNRVMTVPPLNPAVAAHAATKGGTDTRRHRAANITPAIEAITMKCLEKDRAARYPDAKALAEEFDAILKKTDRTTRNAKATKSIVMTDTEMMRVFDNSLALRDLRRTVRRNNRRLAAGSAVLAVTLTALAATVVWNGWRPATRGADPALAELRQKIDLEAAAFRPDQAVARLRALAAIDSDPAIAREADDAESMARLQNRLVTAINQYRPLIAPVQLRGRTLGDAEVLRASTEGLVLWGEGHPVEVAWPTVHPQQIVAWAEHLLGTLEAGDRHGLGLLCWKNGMTEQARTFFRSLAGTPFEAKVRRYFEGGDGN